MVLWDVLVEDWDRWGGRPRRCLLNPLAETRDGCGQAVVFAWRAMTGAKEPDTSHRHGDCRVGTSRKLKSHVSASSRRFEWLRHDSFRRVKGIRGFEVCPRDDLSVRNLARRYALPINDQLAGLLQIPVQNK